MWKMKGKGKIEEPPSEIKGEESIDPLSSLRNWSDLPDALLVSILDFLSFSIPARLAFAGVCRSWRSAAATSSSAYRGPPLLLTPVVSSTRRWSYPARCRIQTLTENNDDDVPTSYKALRGRRIRSYKTLVSSKTLRTRCVGCSYSQLIFVAAGQNAVLADAFTGKEIQTPNFPNGYQDLNFSFGILTAPLASSASSLLLVFPHEPTSSPSILCWRPRSDEWSELKIENCFYNIVSLVVFKGHVFALTTFADLIVVDFVPCMSWKDLKIPLPVNMYVSHGVFYSHLVECDGDLLLVLFVPVEDRHSRDAARVGVYRLDLPELMWVKMENLGDWCLFVDAIRKHAVSCPNPTSWGGRNNCIYFAGLGCDTWIVVPLDGEVLDSTGFPPFEASNFKASKWPSPVWVSPRLPDIQMEARAEFSEPLEDDPLPQVFLDACTIVGQDQSLGQHILPQFGSDIVHDSSE